MRYTSENYLPTTTSLTQLKAIIALLGFEKINDRLKVPNRLASYFWHEAEEYHSYVGIELDVYRKKDRSILVTTRTRVSRSYWELVHQNRTIKTIRELFGGHFQTDAGRNRYWRPDGVPPSPLESGCYIARWDFHNGLIKAQIYLDSRKLAGAIAAESSTGLLAIDMMNPRILSNNLLLPYLVAIWEEYFRSTFAALFKFSKQRESVLKRERLSHSQLEAVAAKKSPVERIIAECFAFQRPSIIVENFRMIDPKLDIGATLRKPYRRRKKSLFESIETLVEDRNEIVHTGGLNLTLFDPQMKQILSDIQTAIDRVYAAIGKFYGFVPSRDF